LGRSWAYGETSELSVRERPGEKVQLIIVDSGATGQITKAVPYTSGTETLDTYDTGTYADLLIRAAECVLLSVTGVQISQKNVLLPLHTSLND